MACLQGASAVHPWEVISVGCGSRTSWSWTVLIQRASACDCRLSTHTYCSPKLFPPQPLTKNRLCSLHMHTQTWCELPATVRNGGRVSKEEALQAVAVVNRIRRAIAAVSDSIVGRIGDVSKAYGSAFGVEAWARDLFPEEVRAISALEGEGGWQFDCVGAASVRDVCICLLALAF